VAVVLMSCRCRLGVRLRRGILSMPILVMLVRPITILSSS